jgi:hypothetical protein
MTIVLAVVIMAMLRSQGRSRGSAPVALDFRLPLSKNYGCPLVMDMA